MVGIPPSSLFIASRPDGFTSVTDSDGDNVTVHRAVGSNPSSSSSIYSYSVEGLWGTQVNLSVSRWDWQDDGTIDEVSSSFRFQGSDNFTYVETISDKNGSRSVNYFRVGNESVSQQDLNGDGKVEGSVTESITAERFEAEQAIVQASEPERDVDGIIVIDKSNVDVAGAKLVNQPPPPPPPPPLVEIPRL